MRTTLAAAQHIGEYQQRYGFRATSSSSSLSSGIARASFNASSSSSNFASRRHRFSPKTFTRKYVHETLLGRAMGHTLNDEELFSFDLNGFLVVKNVFTEEEIEEMNSVVDKHEHEMVERKGQLRLGGKKGMPLAGDGETGRQDLGGMLAWPGEENKLFRKMLTHPKLVPYYIALCGEGYRMDHLPLLIQQKKGADGFDFHGGRLNQDGSWIQG